MEILTGSKVRIMSWNNICKNFTVDEVYNSDGRIEIFIDTPKYGFDEGIKKYCGKLYDVSEVIKEGFYKLDGIEGYVFTDEILKVAEDVKKFKD